ncbi:MAG: nucleotide exchange factor GrpE [Coriobacteriia bacterium]|nr:nucleotide exchange factor GrpE [Coriobacteriia bacterium]
MADRREVRAGGSGLGRTPSNLPGDVDPELTDDLGAELEFRGDVLEADLEAAREEADAMRDLAQRVQAEFENYRKRSTREFEDLRKRAAERVVLNLLPVLDNLERAIDHATADGRSSELLSGVEMVRGQLLDVLDKEGVTPVDPFGQPFDALKHEAVGQREDPEVPDGTVVDVFLKGYEMHGRIIRSAMVVVSTGGPTREA